MRLGDIRKCVPIFVLCITGGAFAQSLDSGLSSTQIGSGIPSTQITPRALSQINNRAGDAVDGSSSSSAGGMVPNVEVKETAPSDLESTRQALNAALARQPGNLTSPSIASWNSSQIASMRSQSVRRRAYNPMAVATQGLENRRRIARTGYGAALTRHFSECQTIVPRDSVTKMVNGMKVAGYTANSSNRVPCAATAHGGASNSIRTPFENEMSAPSAYTLGFPDSTRGTALVNPPDPGTKGPFTIDSDPHFGFEDLQETSFLNPSLVAVRKNGNRRARRRRKKVRSFTAESQSLERELNPEVGPDLTGNPQRDTMVQPAALSPLSSLDVDRDLHPDTDQ